MSPKNSTINNLTQQKNSISSIGYNRNESSQKYVPNKINVANLSKSIKEILSKLILKMRHEEEMILLAT